MMNEIDSCAGEAPIGSLTKIITELERVCECIEGRLPYANEQLDRLESVPEEDSEKLNQESVEHKLLSRLTILYNRLSIIDSRISQINDRLTNLI